MNKFKAWLINKLGGYTEPFPTISNLQLRTESIHYDKTHFEVVLPNWEMPKMEEKYYIYSKIKKMIGEYIIEHKCYTRQRIFNPAIGREVIRYTIIIGIPNEGDENEDN